jgi:tRNA1Val (adenine37-N6)-methyltransferase
MDSLDDLIIGGLKIYQPEHGYRHSIDPVLLSGFVGDVTQARIVDLGTGNGIIPLLLASRGAALVTGLELQPAMVARARRSVALNALEGRVRIVEGDLRDLPAELIAGACELVTANPPFRRIESGRIAPNGERAAARFELHGGLDDFLRAAASLLGSGGRFCIVFLAERLAELLAGMRVVRLEPKRLRLVHSRAADAARLVLVEGRRDAGPGLQVEAPLILYKGEGRAYSEEVLTMYGCCHRQR